MMFGCIFDMKLRGLLVLLFYLMEAACLSPVLGLRSTISELHQPAALPCEVKCSGPVKWIKIQKPSRDAVVAQCNETSCSQEEGFKISHDQYLKGNLSLIVTAADYSKRTWYTCQCDGKDVCDVSLRIKSVGYQRQSCPGESLRLDFPVPQRLKVVFNRTGGDGGAGGAQSSVSAPVCSVDGRKLHCVDEYRKRASLKCSLALSAVQEVDAGVYSIWDTENDELISTHTLTLTGNNTDTNSTMPCEVGSWSLKWIIEKEYRGLTLGVSTGFVIGALFMYFAGWIKMACSYVMAKLRKCWRGDSPQQTVHGEEVKLQNSANDQDDPSNTSH